ncbi:hypothetical protein [Vibrio owensii]|uniref:hypothetical protein n=1 Tax=Vibrio owensii TaxID=696485 RepID=UPI0005EDA977|nr:hypothetical protein [Vibrio owensii]
MPIYDVTYFCCGSKAILKHKQFNMENLQGAKLAALAHLPKSRCDVRICNLQGKLLSVRQHRNEYAGLWSDWSNDPAPNPAFLSP